MMNDIELQENVRQALEWDPSVDAMHIGVTATGGIVTLTGYVKNYFEKKKAEVIAKRIAHVKAVVDELQLQIPNLANRTDLEIAESAVEAIRLNVVVPDDRIKITVDNGHIVLDGEVDWHYQRTAAEDALRPMIGVRGIINKIHVKAAVRVSDVRKKIEDALVRNAHIDSGNIVVEAYGATAVLKGKVRSWAEKEEAEAAAWSAPGIDAVHNEIEIVPQFDFPSNRSEFHRA
jgi:osmotically-inducible protein OsmY